MSSTAPRTRIRGGVGESVERPDSAPKVKGEFQYGSDLRREGMLFGATLRSPHPHARIIGIDTAAAKKMSGVKAIITSAELPTRAVNTVHGTVRQLEYQGTYMKVTVTLNEPGEPLCVVYVEESTFFVRPVDVGQRVVCDWPSASTVTPLK